ncbi:TPA: hypothetical protein LA742_001152 [Clostridium botulinum]|uniref:hypothetical protein n=1 Tax=Clostridium sporogenes TaxID=1509 RepID=UPI000773ACED|nr:hypothetical protein [Clostridium sporogenes]AUM93811.1 hypothetical protein RSJ11_00970 [Clostridium sporogenes]HBJ2612722.1 hypothetical protein [Clostridium botulinum]
MEREEAREYFKNKGLDYSNIKKEDIESLTEFLSEELNYYLENGGFHAKQMDMEVRKQRVKDVKVLKKSGLKYARLRIKGSYFDDREGITFSQTGFIGFGGEFSDVNVAPILKAFCRWCDTLAS